MKICAAFEILRTPNLPEVWHLREGMPRCLRDEFIIFPRSSTPVKNNIDNRQKKS
jgi:hypothetical protein